MMQSRDPLLSPPFAEVAQMLCSLIKGVGPKTAAAMVRTFGLDVLQVLNSPNGAEQLRKVRDGHCDRQPGIV